MDISFNFPQWLPPDQITKKLPDSVIATVDDLKSPKTKQLRGGVNLSCRRMFFVTEDGWRSAAWLQMTPEVRQLMESHPRYYDTFLGLDYRFKFDFLNLRSMVTSVEVA